MHKLPTATPGPGEYEQAAATTLNKGGVKMGELPTKRPASAPSAQRLLGPDDDKAAATTGAKWSFGSGKRPEPAKKAAAAAPSSSKLYLPPSTLGGQTASCKNGAPPPDLKRFEVQPEPCSYNIRSFEPSSKAHSFGTAAQRPSSAPAGSGGAGRLGPGSYGVPQVGRGGGQATGVLNSTSSRGCLGQKDGSSMPGPGHYGSALPPSSGGPAYGFGQASRDRSSSRSRGGVGDCCLNADELGRQRAIESIIAEAEAKAASERKRRTQERPRSSGRAPSFGPRRPPRKKDGPSDQPGPGSYDVSAAAPRGQRSCGFGHGERPPPIEGNGGASPGAIYKPTFPGDIGSGKKGPSFTKGPAVDNPVPPDLCCAQYRLYSSLG